MPYRDLGVQQKSMEAEPEYNSPTYFATCPTANYATTTNTTTTSSNFTIITSST